jgi:hypothetical protein
MAEEHQDDGCCIWFSHLRQVWVLTYCPASEELKELAFENEAGAIAHAKRIGMAWRYSDAEKWEPIDQQETP